MRFASLLLVLAFSAGASAQGVGTTTTISGTKWRAVFTQPVLGLCNEFILDASGDLANSQTMVLAGSLNCPSLGGGYGVTGVGYFDTNSRLNLTLNVANFWNVTCTRMANFAGSCKVFDSLAKDLGFGSIDLRD